MMGDEKSPLNQGSGGHQGSLPGRRDIHFVAVRRSQPGKGVGERKRGSLHLIPSPKETTHVKAQRSLRNSNSEILCGWSRVGAPGHRRDQPGLNHDCLLFAPKSGGSL